MSKKLSDYELAKRKEERIKIYEKDFIEYCSKLYNNFYDYSKVVYIKSSEKVTIVCPIHGEYRKTPNKHKNGQGCPMCVNEKMSKLMRKTLSKFIIDSNKIHNGFYDYSKVVYINSNTEVEIICPIHGAFWQKPDKHINAGHGCWLCYYERNSGENHPNYNSNLSEEDRIERRKIKGYPEWIQNVYERDKYTCQCCGDNTGGNLNAHHKDGYHWCEERRLDVSNGITLCDECHKEFHKIYGYKDNTEKQYEEYKYNIIIIKIKNLNYERNKHYEQY